MQQHRVSSKTAVATAIAVHLKFRVHALQQLFTLKPSVRGLLGGAAAELTDLLKRLTVQGRSLVHIRAQLKQAAASAKDVDRDRHILQQRFEQTVGITPRRVSTPICSVGARVKICRAAAGAAIAIAGRDPSRMEHFAA
jgi:hypothetical protein